MDKKTFIEHLRKGTEDINVKAACINHFIDNYPVLIEEKSQMGFPTSRKTWTKLQGIKVKAGSKRLFDYAFRALRGRVSELEKFDN